MAKKKRPSRRLHSDARARKDETGEKFTAAREAVTEGADSPVMARDYLAGEARLPYDGYDLWMDSESMPGEDPRTLNGIHLTKALNDHYETWTIYDDPRVEVNDDDEEDVYASAVAVESSRVDSGGFFDLTPIIRCSVNAIYGVGWRIQLRRFGVSTGNSTVIQSATYRYLPIDDAYLAAAVALHTGYRFLTAVEKGESKHWRLPEAGARALFPSGAVKGAYEPAARPYIVPYEGVAPEQAPARLAAERARAAAAWVDLMDRWSHWFHNWPIDDQFDDFARYFAESGPDDVRARFKQLRKYYRKPLRSWELD